MGDHYTESFRQIKQLCEAIGVTPSMPIRCKRQQHRDMSADGPAEYYCGHSTHRSSSGTYGDEVHPPALESLPGTQRHPIHPSNSDTTREKQKYAKAGSSLPGRPAISWQPQE